MSSTEIVKSIGFRSWLPLAIGWLRSRRRLGGRRRLLGPAERSGSTATRGAIASVASPARGRSHSAPMAGGRSSRVSTPRARASAIATAAETVGSWRGALARLPSIRTNKERRPWNGSSIEHEDRRDFVVAASASESPRSKATSCRCGPRREKVRRALRRSTVTRWNPRVGGRSLSRGHAHDSTPSTRRSSCSTAMPATRSPRSGRRGTIYALAVRPGAVRSWPWPRLVSRAPTVEVDEKRVELYGLDGTRRARVDVPGVAMSIAWSPARRCAVRCAHRQRARESKSGALLVR